MTARKRIKSRIERIKDANNQWIDHQQGMATVFCNYFRNLFTKTISPPEMMVKTRLQEINIPFLKENHKEWLNRPFCLIKVK